MVKGHNRLAFEVQRGWEQLPEGWTFAEVAGVACDSADRVYVFCRGEHPVIVFDRDGRFLDAWGEGVFTNPHGIFIGTGTGTAGDGVERLYLADNGDHTVRICSPEGTVEAVLGEPGVAADTGFEAWSTPVQYAGGPFNRVTNAALAPNGDLYVTDGYGNARVHVFDAAGALRFSWGEPGEGPGQFRLPHGLAVDRRGTVYVADRENARVQVFTPSGEYVTELTDIWRPDDLFIDAQENLFVAELGYRAGKMPRGMGHVLPPHEVGRRHERHARVSVLTLDGEVQMRLGGTDPAEPGSFFAPHGLWADSRGDIYVGEVVASGGGRAGLVPMDCHSLQKFVRHRA
jgi:DNA-binding beta-propeller fold protein YncE